MGLLGSDSNIYPDSRSRTHPIHGPLRFFFVSRAPVLLAGCMLPLIWGRRLLWVFSASTRLRYVSSQGPPISSQLAVASSLRSEWASAGNQCGSSGQVATRRDAFVGRLCETRRNFVTAHCHLRTCGSTVSFLHMVLSLSVVENCRQRVNMRVSTSAATFVASSAPAARLVLPEREGRRARPHAYMATNPRTDWLGTSLFTLLRSQAPLV